MSIPIDKLYYYIDNAAREIHGDIIIYRFHPHGSKKIEDCISLHERSLIDFMMLPEIYANDQEPLNYQYYRRNRPLPELLTKLMTPHLVNLRLSANIYDQAVLLHSEKRSINLEQYQQDNYVSVYYWCHAVVARDWFRFAVYEKLKKNLTKTFLIYNRAWAGTREYRIKFIDLLITYNLIDQCQTSFNPIDPECGVHYSQHVYINPQFCPRHVIETVVGSKHITSTASADYELGDYQATEFEVVLETLYDDERLHLTEKILRPIALGQPFLLAATHGSLEYLRSYGFKTFDSVVDESYDTIEDPYSRLEALVAAMNKIANWSTDEREKKLAQANQIAAYNKNHFFSDKFINQVTDELKVNLQHGLNQVENTNTSQIFLNRRKQFAKHAVAKKWLLSFHSRADTVRLLTKAKAYQKLNR